MKLARGLKYSKILAVSVGVLAFSGSSFAALSSCAGSTVAVIQAAVANNPASGCGVIDIGFNNFVVGASGGAPTATGITVAGTGGTVTAGTPATITPILETFAAAGWTIANNTVTMVSTVSELVRALPNSVTGAGAANYPTAPYVQWGITGMTLAANVAALGGNAGNNGNSITVKEEFCLGQATFTCTAASAGYGFIQTRYVYTSGSATPTITNTICTPGAGACVAGTGLSIALSGFVTQISVINTATLVRVTGFGQTLDLNSFTDGFLQAAETPEPATFGLMGSALAGLALLATRRRKK